MQKSLSQDQPVLMVVSRLSYLSPLEYWLYDQKQPYALQGQAYDSLTELMLYLKLSANQLCS